MAAAFRYWAALMFVGVVVQIGLAGVGAFHFVDKADGKTNVDGDAALSWFDPHVILGYVLVLAALVLVILAYAARRARLRWSGTVLVLLVLQVVFAWLGDGVSWLGWLHPVNALAIFYGLYQLARLEWLEPAGELPAKTTPAT